MKAIMIVLMLFFSVPVQAGIRETLGNTWEKSVPYLTHPKVMFFAFQFGLSMYTYYNAQADAFIFPYRDKYHRAKVQYWHSNKNLANLGLLISGGVMGYECLTKRYTGRQYLFRIGYTVMGADALWHRSYYYGKWGTQFPEESWKFANRIVIPLVYGDVRIGLTNTQVHTADTVEWSLYLIGLLRDPVWNLK